MAFENSPLTPEDLNEIPFTLLIPDCPATFMEHKRCVVHIARAPPRRCTSSSAARCRSTSTS